MIAERIIHLTLAKPGRQNSPTPHGDPPVVHDFQLGKSLHFPSVLPCQHFDDRINPTPLERNITANFFVTPAAKELNGAGHAAQSGILLNELAAIELQYDSAGQAQPGMIGELLEQPFKIGRIKFDVCVQVANESVVRVLQMGIATLKRERLGAEVAFSPSEHIDETDKIIL